MPNTAEGFVALDGSALQAAAGFVRSERLLTADTQVDVVVRLRQRADAPPPDMKAWTHTPLVDRKYLTEEKYSALYGASDGDISEVLKFASSFGLSVINEGDSKAKWMARRAMTLRGTAADHERAFAVALGIYENAQNSNETYVGREGLVHVPTALAGIIEGVFGLDSRPLVIRGRDTGVVAVNAVPHPVDMAKNYDFPGVKAPKQHIALMQFGGGYYHWDIDKYFTKIGLPTIIEVGIDGHVNNPGQNPTYDREVTLDICIAGSVAQEATLYLYFAPHTEAGWYKALDDAIADTNISVISISWGAPELQTSNSLTWSADGMHAMQALFKKAVMKGKTVLASSGNHGSSAGLTDRRGHVAYPASDPNVIGCGGTSIPDFANSPKVEASWSSSGGGVSDFADFAVPAYQAKIDLPSSVNDGRERRGVPDVSGYASPGYTFFYRDEPFTAPGTSLVAPLYAALIAQINAEVGRPIGWIHGKLYDPANAGVFTDMTSTTDNSSGYAPGYRSGAGWDALSGLGVINGKKLRKVF